MASPEAPTRNEIDSDSPRRSHKTGETEESLVREEQV